MFKKFLILGVTALSMVATSAIAADVSRVRLMVPVQASDAASYDAGDTKPDSVSASGYNLQYVHSSGFGIGYTSTSLKKDYGSLGWMEYKDATFVDLSYTFGSEMTGQIVIGTLTGHGGVAYNDGVSTSAKESSGSAWGINGGYDFGGFEALLGYRSETVKVTQEGSSSENDAGRTLISAGIGFTF